MWKKNETEVSPQTVSKKPAPNPRVESTPRKARIGAGLVLKGELHGGEDVVIEGRVEGRIELAGNSVIIEEAGTVDGDVTAKSISVAGEVRGNLDGKEQVVLLTTGRVEGNIAAKSVTLETGAQFKGSVDMEVAGPTKPSPSLSSSRSEPSSAKKPNGTTRVAPN